MVSGEAPGEGRRKERRTAVSPVYQPRFPLPLSWNCFFFLTAHTTAWSICGREQQVRGSGWDVGGCLGAVQGLCCSGLGLVLPGVQSRKQRSFPPPGTADSITWGRLFWGRHRGGEVDIQFLPLLSLLRPLR